MPSQVTEDPSNGKNMDEFLSIKPLNNSIKYRRPRFPFYNYPWDPDTRIQYNEKIIYTFNEDLRKVLKISQEKRIKPTLSSIFLKKLAPAGFQYKWPYRRIWGILVKIIPKMTNLPNLPDENSFPNTVNEIKKVETDCLIVGAGPSGIVFKKLLEKKGIESIVVEKKRIGGHINLLSERVKKQWLGEVYNEVETNIENVLENTTYIGEFEDYVMAYNRKKRIQYLIKPKCIIFASGGITPYPIFENNDLPGIISAEFFLELLKTNSISRNHRVTFLVDGEWGKTVVEEAKEKLKKIVVISKNQASNFFDTNEVQVYDEVEELIARGREKIGRIVVKTRQKSFTIDTDILVIALNRIPELNILAQSGFQVLLTGKQILLKYNGKNNIFKDIIGEARGTIPNNMKNSIKEVLENMESFLQEDKKDRKRGFLKKEIVLSLKPESFIFTNNIEGMKIVCRCQDITLKDIITSYNEGFKSMETIKRHTALGTGVCQGRYCQLPSIFSLKKFLGADPNKIGFFRIRPPLEPIEISSLVIDENEL